MEILLDTATQEKINYYLPKNSTLNELAQFFSVFSDVTRAKILCALSISEMCVSDISALLNLNQTTCSHQLKLLKLQGVVSDRRMGKVVYYSLKSEQVEDVLHAGVKFLGYWRQNFIPLAGKSACFFYKVV